MLTLTRSAEELLRAYRKHTEKRQSSAEEERISVDEIASKIASFYEKFRNVIDYQESHLLRKNVIGRALRRRVFLKDIGGEEIAEPLIREIIRSGHLPNNSISLRKIEDVQGIIDTFLFFQDHFKSLPSRDRRGLSDWLLGITVCALEEMLVPPQKDRALADMMFETLRKDLSIGNAELENRDKDILLFIAIQKSLFRVDNDQLHHRARLLMLPEWKDAKAGESSHLTDHLVSAHQSIASYLKHPLLPSFLKLCNHYNTVFHIIGDLVFAGKGFSNLEADVQAAYEERYRRERGRLFRMAFLSVISFFLSKILVAVAIEIPIDVYLLDEFSLAHTLANIVFPPLLMLLIIASIRLPSRKNLYLVQNEVRSALYAEESHPYAFKIPKKQGWFVSFLVNFIYLAVFVLTIRVMSRVLLSFGFSIANIVVFLLFTSLVTAVGVKIYNRSKEISLEKERPRFFTFLLDLLTIPLVTIGKWLISGFKRFNVFVIFVNLIIEFPFQLLLELLESLHEFVRAKKDEIQ